jgi:two-component system cell cycle response regulator
MKILIADDNATSRRIIQMVPRVLGHDCHVAGTGDEAWDMFVSLRPDVVISDWKMPGLTGVELCRRIRAHDDARYTYFIMVTGQGALDQILEGMNAGADDYLVKPLDPDNLKVRLVAATRVTSLHGHLDRRRTELEGANDDLTAIARRDPLTGIGNRRALDEDLAVLDARVTRYGHRYCMALIDVDFFKSYNDTYGHPAGDHVLQTVAAELDYQARGGDTLYRFGGDEFLGIFPEQSLATGVLAVHRMRIGLERLAIPHDGNPLGVLTISAGVAMLDRDRVAAVTDVLKEADVALYRAKQLGRNRVEQTPSKDVDVV